MRQYKGIDIGRIMFACMIPFLHIGIKGEIAYILSQYVARIGVPFFYAVAGMFLARSIERSSHIIALRKYAFKIGRMLILWLLIYLPILLLRQERMTVQEMLFKTPAYLWYLTGLLFAAVPFCLIKNRKALLIASLVLYTFGTLFGDTYRWLIGGFPVFEAVFLTTRNGLFFGLPLMCIGEATWGKQKTSFLGILLLGGILIAEITIVGLYVSPMDDRSMYLSLPGFIYFFVILFREWNPDLNTMYLGGISSAIYVMQFGVITILIKTAEILGVSGNWIYWIIWIMVIVFPTAFYMALRKTRLVKVVF